MKRQHEDVLVFQQRRAQARRAVDLGAVVELARGVHRHAVVVDAPHAGDVEILERQAERIDHAVARDARRIACGALPCARASTARAAGRRALVSSSSGTFGGGGGGGEPSSTSITHLPRMHRRRAIGDRGQQQHAALAENAAARIGQRDAPEFVAGDVGDAVVPGDALVDEGIVGRQQVGDAAIVAHEAVEEELGLLAQSRVTASYPQ